MRQVLTWMNHHVSCHTMTRRAPHSSDLEESSCSTSKPHLSTECFRWNGFLSLRVEVTDVNDFYGDSSSMSRKPMGDPYGGAMGTQGTGGLRNMVKFVCRTQRQHYQIISEGLPQGWMDRLFPEPHPGWMDGWMDALPPPHCSSGSSAA